MRLNTICHNPVPSTQHPAPSTFSMGMRHCISSKLCEMASSQLLAFHLFFTSVPNNRVQSSREISSRGETVVCFTEYNIIIIIQNYRYRKKSSFIMRFATFALVMATIVGRASSATATKAKAKAIRLIDSEVGSKAKVRVRGTTSMSVLELEFFGWHQHQTCLVFIPFLLLLHQTQLVSFSFLNCDHTL